MRRFSRPRDHQDRAWLHGQGRTVLDSKIAGDHMWAVDSRECDVHAHRAAENRAMASGDRKPLGQRVRRSLIHDHVVHTGRSRQVRRDRGSQHSLVYVGRGEVFRVRTEPEANHRCRRAHEASATHHDWNIGLSAARSGRDRFDARWRSDHLDVDRLTVHTFAVGCHDIEGIGPNVGLLRSRLADRSGE